MKNFDYWQQKKAISDAFEKKQVIDEGRPDEKSDENPADAIDSISAEEAVNENESLSETKPQSEEKAAVDEPVSESVEKSEQQAPLGVYRDGSNDDLSEDAEEGASEYDPSDDIEPDEAAESVSDEEESDSETKDDTRDGYPATDDEQELVRREAEKQLRKRTAAANNRNKLKSKSVNREQSSGTDSVPMSTLKRFPSGLAYHIKSLFPEARTMDEAVAAYVYIKEGEPDDIQVPSDIKDIAKSYVGLSVTPKDVQDELMKELHKLREFNTKFMKKLNSVELGVAYAIFDRFGFRKANALTPAELNFLEAGIADLVKQLEKQSEIKQNRDAQKSGRPIK